MPFELNSNIKVAPQGGGVGNAIAQGLEGLGRIQEQQYALEQQRIAEFNKAIDISLEGVYGADRDKAMKMYDEYQNTVLSAYKDSDGRPNYEQSKAIMEGRKKLEMHAEGFRKADELYRNATFNAATKITDNDDREATLMNLGKIMEIDDVDERLRQLTSGEWLEISPPEWDPYTVIGSGMGGPRYYPAGHARQGQIDEAATRATFENYATYNPEGKQHFANSGMEWDEYINFETNIAMGQGQQKGRGTPDKPSGKEIALDGKPGTWVNITVTKVTGSGAIRTIKGIDLPPEGTWEVVSVNGNRTQAEVKYKYPDGQVEPVKVPYSQVKNHVEDKYRFTSSGTTKKTTSIGGLNKPK